MRVTDLTGGDGVVHAKCMAVKTITIDIEAYERLSRRKGGGKSFSQVIKEHFPQEGATAGELLEALDRTAIADETLDAVERVIAERQGSPVRVPRW